MKKLLLLFLLSPIFLAFQCEPGEPCTAKITQKSKPNLITIENLQATYNVGDIIWLNSTLEKNQNFDNPNETIDLFSYPLEYAFGIQFYKSSIYNPQIYLCLNSTTTEISIGNLNALQTVGYRELFDYFDEKTTLEFAIEQIKMNTRRFAKRQITWFKRTENVSWFDYLTSREEIISAIKSKNHNS